MTNSVLHKGFTFIGLLVALVLAMVIGVLSIPTYNAFVQQGEVARAIADLGRISLEVERYRLRHAGMVPVDLSTIGLARPIDPWGRPFQFEALEGHDNSSVIRATDRIPLNTDYDLFSHGPDGSTGANLFAPESRDNIVRALDGGFFGVATDLMTTELASIR